MSKDHAPSLHIEWAPGRVQAVDIANGRRRSATSLSEMSSFLSGHKTVLVGISRQLTFLKAVSLPRANAEDLRRILAIQLSQHFPLPADQLTFDFYQTTEQAEDGFLTLVAAVRADDIRQLNSELAAAGVRAARILPVALGSAAVAARANRPAALVVESAPGLGYTIDVTAGGIVRFSRTVPDSGSLEREVQRTQAAAGVDNLTVLVAGGDSDSNSVASRLGDALVQPRTALELLHEAPVFAFELAESRELERRKRVAGYNRVAGLSAVAALCMVTVVWLDHYKDASAASHTASYWSGKISKAKTLADAVTARENDAKATAMVLDQAFHVAQPLGDVASVIGDSLPKSGWLTGLNLQRGKAVQIRGTVTDPDDVARYLKTLTDTGRFRDVRLVVANSAKVSTKPVVQFNISAFPIGNLPMPAPDVKKAGAVKRAPTGTSTDSEAKQ